MNESSYKFTEVSYSKNELCCECIERLKKEASDELKFRKKIVENSSNIKCLKCHGPLIRKKEQSESEKKKDKQSNKQPDNKSHEKESKNYCKLLVCIAAISCIMLVYMFYREPESKVDKMVQNFDPKIEIQTLRSKYNQSIELWATAKKMINDTGLQAEALILLHDDGNRFTAECLAKDLANLVMKKHKINDEVLFFDDDHDPDYGNTLNKYRKLVSSTKHLVVLDLQNVSASTARIFHSLCDDINPPITPSYFIFTLQISRAAIKQKKIMANAGDVLRTAWSFLKDNELEPLISRVVRNVVEIAPEKITSCP